MQLTLPLRARPRPAALGRAGVGVRLALAILVLAVVFAGGEPTRDLRVRQAAGRYTFLLLDWELARLGERATRIGAGLLGRGGHENPDPAAQAAAARYFAAPPTMREPLRAEAEAAIERGLTRMLASEGLGVPMPFAPRGSIVFPPVSFSFVSPPQVLIVSPRDRIAVDQSQLLRPDVTLEQAASLETAVDRLGVSSLVVPIGGLATYPAMVLEGTRPLDALVGVAHEWIHGYFFFQPLGRTYWSSQTARAINETAADLASQELGERLVAELDLVQARPARRGAGPEGPPTAGTPPSGRDFRTVLRQTRIEVDALLAAGRLDEAEASMRERRDELAAAGHDLRKLNQAYFAFYGSYGDAASGSSPIGGRLRRLREVSGSVGEFLVRVARLTDGQDLARAVGDA